MPHFCAVVLYSFVDQKGPHATFEDGDMRRNSSMLFASLPKVGRLGTFGGTRFLPPRYQKRASSSKSSSSSAKTNDAMMMQQKPADQKRVALGVACGLVACAIPFLFKDVQKRELEVAHARDGGGGGGILGKNEGGGTDEKKEDARKERLMTNSRGRKR